MSKLKQAYLKYLQSEHWRNLREQAFKRDGYKCCHCGTRHNLRGHHMRYGKDLYKIPLKHIQTLCESCHDAYHREKARNRRLNRRERRQQRQEVSRLTWLICAFGLPCDDFCKNNSVALFGH